jgi:preprotein translocase subunit SecG
MATVLLIIHIIIALAMIGVVLLQRSEGGALGIGGGGGGAFMTGRGAANLLTRATAWLAAAFFATSLLLSLVGSRAVAPRSILDSPAENVQPSKPSKAPKAPTDGSQLPSIDLKNLPSGPLPETDAPEKPRVPQSK